MAYEFHYTPTGTGVISGKEVLEQTEDAINDLGNTAISGVQEALDKAEQALTNSQNAVDDAQTALNTANNAEGVAIQAQTDVGNLSGTVTNIGNRVTTAEGNISNLQGRMTTAESNITNLQGRMTTAETNIGNLQTAVSTAQATANSAQQTATTARQQSYVFRYSGTAITNNSTIAYSTIDNTDNIKSGDKILDVDGKLFEITAVDTTNETVTVGSALIDLAQDSDVVHKSGNETIGGTKDFADVLRIYNSNASSNTAQLQLKNSKVNRGQAVFGDQAIWFRDSLDKVVTAVISRVTSTGASALLFQAYNVDQNNQQVSNYLSFVKNLDGSCYLLPDQNDVIVLGSSLSKFKSVNTNQVNGINPDALSLPSDRSARIDISSYFTNTGTGDTNAYTVPANGFIYLSVTDVVTLHVFSQTSGGLTNYGDTRGRNSVGLLNAFLPVRKDDVFVSQWYTTLTNVSLTSAYFIPCQGNV